MLQFVCFRRSSSQLENINAIPSILRSEWGSRGQSCGSRPVSDYLQEFVSKHVLIYLSIAADQTVILSLSRAIGRR